ncbi:MAG TPA: uroporphyrinogen-III synthase [Bacteroidales bacterium]|nr:uroporphyrinogen-III synthase [Bacteroidales bacterium]
MNHKNKISSKIKSILISQPKPAEDVKSPYLELAKKYKLDITFRKFITIEGIPAKEFRKDKINILDFTAIIMTSRNAVDHFFRICDEMKITIPETLKYFCISESTAYYLQKYVQFRKRKIFCGKQDFNELIEVIKKHKNEKFLLPCSDIHKQDIPQMLDECEIFYKKAILYKTLASDLSDININDYDMLVFFSPAGIKSLFKNFPNFTQGNKHIGAFGATTAKAVKDTGLILNVEAPTKKAPSMAMALDQYIEKINNKK